MGRGGNRFLEHWHHRQLVLDDGRMLAWIAMLDREPGCVDCFRLDGVAVHPSIGVPLLVASGHPDAELRMRSGDVLDGPSREVLLELPFQKAGQEEMVMEVQFPVTRAA